MANGNIELMEATGYRACRVAKQVPRHEAPALASPEGPVSNAKLKMEARKLREKKKKN